MLLVELGRDALQLIIHWLDLSGLICLKLTSRYFSRMAIDCQSKDLAIAACNNGHLGIVKWLYKQYAFFDSRCYTIAAKGGHLPVIRYLWTKRIAFKSNKHPNTCNFIIRSVENNHLHILKWWAMIDGTFLGSKNDDMLIAASHSPECLVWMIERTFVDNPIAVLRPLLDTNDNTLMQYVAYKIKRTRSNRIHWESLEWIKSLPGSMNIVNMAGWLGDLDIIKRLITKASTYTWHFAAESSNWHNIFEFMIDLVPIPQEIILNQSTRIYGVQQWCTTHNIRFISKPHPAPDVLHPLEIA